MTAIRKRQQFYDPSHLVLEVQVLLRERGLDLEAAPGDSGMAAAGAGMLLRALGVTPAVDGVDALARSMDKPWAGRDDER
ncbi:hypothetical protein [Nonomuraea sp. NPDC003754]